MTGEGNRECIKDGYVVEMDELVDRERFVSSENRVAYLKHVRNWNSSRVEGRRVAKVASFLAILLSCR